MFEFNNWNSYVATLPNGRKNAIIAKYIATILKEVICDASVYDLRSVTVARMEVPCCGGLERAVRQAIAASGKDIPLRVATIAIDGSLLPER